jgi:uncharacterized protein involved in exopolysaccharide biosynthesis
MNGRDILLFAFKWKWTILGWFLFIAGLVTVYVLTSPQSYRADATVLIERTQAPIMASSVDEGGGRFFNAPEMAEAMNTEIEIVRSRPVVEAVVDSLFLPECADPEVQGGGDSVICGEGPGQVQEGEGMFAGLKHRVESIMQDLGLISPVPSREAWIGTVQSSLRTKPVVDSNILEINYLHGDPVVARDVVNAITGAYLSHRLQVYSTRGASEYYERQMNEAGEELARMRAELVSLKERNGLFAIAQTQEQLVREIGTLRDRLTAERATLGDLSTRFGPGHPRIVVVRDNIASLEEQMAARSRDLENLERWASVLDDLEVRIASQEEVFVAYRTRFEEERAKEGITENLVNARVVQAATVPAQPTFSRMTRIGIGAFGGLMVGLLLAFIREYFDQRVEDPESAERALGGVPVLGSVGKSRAFSKYSKSRQSGPKDSGSSGPGSPGYDYLHGAD